MKEPQVPPEDTPEKLEEVRVGTQESIDVREPFVDYPTTWVVG